MSEGTAVANVIRVLKAHDVSARLIDPAKNLYMVERGDFMEEMVLANPVGKYYLNYLKRKLSIPIHHFWNPEMAEADQKEREKKEQDNG
jgi:hypothetical protein